MGSVGRNGWDDEYSEIGEKSEAVFLDFEDDQSLHSFNLLEEGPVVISAPFPFVGGMPQSAFVGRTSVDSIDIKNTSCEPTELWSVRIFSSNPEDSYVLSLMKPPADDADNEAKHVFMGLTYVEERTIQPGQTLTIWLSCKPKELGLHTSIVHFDLGDEKIERVAFLLADDNVSQALVSTKPYVRAHSQRKKFDSNNYVPGSRPTRQHIQGFKFRLPQYAISVDIREILDSNQIPDVIMEQLNADNYAKLFSTLLVMEEIHLEDDMRAYDMECVAFTRRGGHFLTLEVPGLAERRPSLVNGDYIFVRAATDNPGNDTRPYQGYIHRVEADEIFLRFDKGFHLCHKAGDLYNVSFTYNRLNMRRLYHSIHVAQHLGPEVLFPGQLSFRRMIRRSSFTPLSRYLNHEQALSVGMILGCKGGPPYVIYGPPGTGKTMTLVEAILQLYTARKGARILVCSSSNSAADHVLEKLLDAQGVGIRETEIFRLNAPSRPYEDVNPDFIRFCFFDEMVFKCPPLKALLKYKIIISTYMSASLLCAEGIRSGHFSHIFLDEAGQASEPETMVPISSFSLKNTVVVLAGDPMQLGPVVYSRDAEEYGLGRSYLERLFECECYADGDENYVTKLVRNYRSHPAILELPSKLFYGGDLIACSEDSGSPLYELMDLPNKSFPVLFVGIQGCDEREGSNPSWFNRIEVSKVVEIIRKLMGIGGVDEADVGVITPYRQQVLKLKMALESLEMPDLKVGSVEQFQGQERQIIIISTVRSTVRHNEFDRVHNLGFLSNSRRFNVAITRAKSLLIIVANPHIITKDWYWDKLLRHCSDNGSYVGCPLPPPEIHDVPENGPAVHGGEQQDISPLPVNGDEEERLEDMPTEALPDTQPHPADEEELAKDVPKPVLDEAGQNEVDLAEEDNWKQSSGVAWSDYSQIPATGWDD